MCLLCVCLSVLFYSLHSFSSSSHSFCLYIRFVFVLHSWCPCFLFLSISLSHSLSDRTAAHKDVCFQEVDEDLICTMPRVGLAVTYSECCCHYGHGWGPECRTCPQRNSGRLTAVLLEFYRFFGWKTYIDQQQVLKRAYFCQETQVN